METRRVARRVTVEVDGKVISQENSPVLFVNTIVQDDSGKKFPVKYITVTIPLDTSDANA